MSSRLKSVLILMSLIWLKMVTNHPIKTNTTNGQETTALGDFLVPIITDNSIQLKSLNSLNTTSNSSSSSSSSNVNILDSNKNENSHENAKSKRGSLVKKSIDPLWYLSKYGYLDSTRITQHKRGSLIMYPPGLSMSRTVQNNQNEPAPLSSAIKLFQKFAKLNQTGILDESTIRMMQMPRCGHPDLYDDGRFLFNNRSNASSKRFRSRRYALQGSKWPKAKLRFRVGKYPKYPSMTREMIDLELKRAFELWSEASDVEFEHVKEPDETVVTGSRSMKPTFMDLLLFDESMLLTNKPSSAVDIEIRFETGYHGDSEPFDGSGLILGHAYFPEFGGSTHFDADEFWTSKSPDGVNLFQVAVHEFGHALGLEHSDNFDAIMAPFFRGYSDDFRLHTDDLTAIELLYGKSKRRQTSQQSSSSSTTPERDEKETFRNNMPSIYDNDNDIFAYKPVPTSIFIPILTTTTPLTTESSSSPPSVPFTPILPEYLPPSQTYEFSSSSSSERFRFQEPEYLDPTATNNLCLDGTFDAVTLLSDGYTYVFKDAYVYKFDNNFILDKEFPRLINSVFKGWNGMTTVSLPIKLDTVLYLPENGVTYFFKNNLYWRSSRLYELDVGYPRFISENFRGLDAASGFTGRLDASFVWSGNRRVYFVEDNKYWRYDFDLGNVEPGYPKKLSIWRGLPSKITDAFLWINGVTYFFVNEKYYRFNDLAFKVEDAIPTYPRFNVDYWFGCSRFFNKLGNLMLTTKRPNNRTNLTELSQPVMINDLEMAIREIDRNSSIDEYFEHEGRNLTARLVRNEGEAILDLDDDNSTFLNLAIYHSTLPVNNVLNRSNSSKLIHLRNLYITILLLFAFLKRFYL